jgi:hypothetical protein
LRTIAAAHRPVMFQSEGSTIPAHLAFDHRVDVLRDLRKAGWIVLEVWVAEPGRRGHARRRYSAAQACCTESGREALEMIGG